MVWEISGPHGRAGLFPNGKVLLTPVVRCVRVASSTSTARNSVWRVILLRLENISFSSVPY